MSDIVEYNTLDDVHSAFIDWESEGKAGIFAVELIDTAKKCVCAASEINYDESDMKKLEDAVYSKLYWEGSLRLCLTDDFKKLVIRYHARGYSTTKAINLILGDDTFMQVTPFWCLSKLGCGYENIKKFLVGRMSYLKPQHPRFPHKKFGAYWESERADYVDRIKNIPLSHPNEQLLKLSVHYSILEQEYSLLAISIEDKERIHKLMMETISAIHTITGNMSIPEAPSRQAIPEKQPPALEAPKTDVVDIPVGSETSASTPSVVVNNNK